MNISNGSATSKVGAHKALSADGLIKALRTSFEVIDDPFPGDPDIPLADALLSAYAVFSLKAPSLLDFERRRTTDVTSSWEARKAIMPIYRPVWTKQRP